MSKPRFSKQALLEGLQIAIDSLKKEHGFRHDNGWNQVRGKGEEANRAYGEFEAYSHVRDMIETWNQEA